MHRILFLLCLMLAPGLVMAGPWVIEPVNVIDVETGMVMSDRSVLIEKDRIAAITVYEKNPAGRDPALEVVDGQGGFLIPGLAEMHAHVPSRSQGESQALKVMALFLGNGVTTIRGMLGEPWHLELRERLESGELRGPRLVTSGPSFNGNTVNSPEQGVERVHEQAAAGYDFLKIHPGLSREEFNAIAAAAREAGLPIAGHVSFETGLDAALAARMDCIDHLDSYAQEMVPEGHRLHGEPPQFFGLNLGGALDPARARALALATAEAGVWNAPTQSLFETTAGADSIEDLLARPGMDMLSDGLRDQWVGSVNNIRGQASADMLANFLEARRTLIAALQDADAELLLGSDAPQIMNVPGYSAHQELEYLVRAGLTPLQALQTGTINVARYFGSEDSGAVAPGMVADLVLLGANPLEDISHTQSILGVVRAGAFHDRATIDEWFERIRADGI